MKKLGHDQAESIGEAKKRFLVWRKSLSTEQLIHYVALASIITYCTGYVLLESGDNEGTKHRRLGDGWGWFGKRKDIADFEWTFWISDLRGGIIFALLNHIAISVIARAVFPEAHKLAQTLFCVYCINWLLGYQYVILVVAQTLFIAALRKINNQYVYWSVAVAWLSALHYEGNVTNFLVSDDVRASQSLSLLAYSGLIFSALRIFGFILEDNHDDESPATLAYEALTYNFYLPFFFFGPVMTYDVFIAKKFDLQLVDEYIRIAKEIITTICCVIAIDFMLHFLHITALPSDGEFLHNAPGVVLGFVMFANVMLDWVKAWVLYSISSGIASHVDGYGGAPHSPKCMANLYTFADTYFDRGIHHWACRYIYDPIGLDHSSVKLEILAGGATFAFVAVWQGGGVAVIIWALLNWFGLSFEFAVQQWAIKRDVIDKRVFIVFGSLNYLMILLFNCVAIIGLEPTITIIWKLLIEDTIGCFLTMVAMYCYVTIIHQHREQDTKEAKKDD